MPDDTLGSRIRYLRENLGLTQAGLAKDVGLSRKQIGNIERGAAKQPQPPNLLRIAERLGTTPAVLRGEVHPDQDEIRDAIRVEFAHLLAQARAAGR